MGARTRLFVTNLPPGFSVAEVLNVLEGARVGLESAVVEGGSYEMRRESWLLGAVLTFGHPGAAEDAAEYLDGRLVRSPGVKAEPTKYLLRAAAAVHTLQPEYAKQKISTATKTAPPPPTLTRAAVANMPGMLSLMDIVALLDSFGLEVVEICVSRPCSEYVHASVLMNGKIELKDLVSINGVVVVAEGAEGVECDPFRTLLLPSIQTHMEAVDAAWVPEMYRYSRGPLPWCTAPRSADISIRVYDDAAGRLDEDILERILAPYSPGRFKFHPQEEAKPYAVVTASLQRPEVVLRCVRDLTSRYVYDTGEMRMAIAVEGARKRVGVVPQMQTQQHYALRQQVPVPRTPKVHQVQQIQKVHRVHQVQHTPHRAPSYSWEGWGGVPLQDAAISCEGDVEL